MSFVGRNHQGKRMNWDAIVAIAETIGAVAVVVTLIALWRQMKQNTQALSTSVYDSAMGGYNDLIRFLHSDAEASSLIRRGWFESRELTADEAFRLNIFVRYYVNHSYKLFRLYQRGVLPPDEWARAAAECSQLMSLPAGVRFRQSNHFYDDLWTELEKVEMAEISAFQFGVSQELKADSPERSVQG